MKERLPKFWHDDHGTLRLLMLYPVEGSGMARRPEMIVTAISVRELRDRFREGKSNVHGS